MDCKWVSRVRTSSARRVNISAPAWTSWLSVTLMACTTAWYGACTGSSPLSGTRTNGQRTVSGICTKIAAISPSTKTRMNNVAMPRAINGGGSVGSIADVSSKRGVLGGWRRCS